MLYGFIDERYRFPVGPNPRFITVACLAVPQGRYNERIEQVTALRRRDRTGFLPALDAVLDAIEGYAVVGTATIDSSLLRYDETDRFLDIPGGMARTDNVWSAAVVFTVGRALASMRLYSGPFSNADLYFDPKTLKPEHLDAFTKTLRQEIPPIHREWCESHGWKIGRKISIRRIQFVKKPRSSLSKFQLGIILADALCTASERSFRGLRRIERVLLAPLIERSSSQLDQREE